MKPKWISIKIIASKIYTKEEFVCTICSLQNPCYKISFLGDKPKSCLKDQSNIQSECQTQKA